jgi:hypothetical protein
MVLGTVTWAAGGHMKYALLIYSPTGAREYEAPRPETDANIASYVAALRDAGVFVAAEQLTHTDTATSVRIRGEERLLTDGPFLETKEHLLGFVLIDVPDLDAALEWAARTPAAAIGTVEVRAVKTREPWHAMLG